MVCALWLALGLATGARAQSAAIVPTPDPASRQILVMVRLSPDHLMPNAGYGGPYGDQLTSNLRRRLAEQIARRNNLDFVGDGWAMPLLGVDCYVMRVPPALSVEAAIARVERDPQVAWSEPMRVYQARSGGAPEGDPLFAVQPAARAWRLADLHRVATGRGVVVAVVDSRVEVNHPDLSGQFVADEDFVAGRPSGPERHGTGVAGVIAAKGGNGIGIVGVAPGARLMALRACWHTENDSLASPTFCDSLSLAKAINFAIEHRAGVINLSLAGPPDRLLRQLIQMAATRNITVVAAYDPALPKGGFPASEPSVIAVTNQNLAAFPAGVYSAPGQDIPTTQPGGKWYLVNGSSYAAAHVSGLVALVREVHAANLRPMLVAAQATGGPIDACATLSRAGGACSCAPCAATIAQSRR